MKNLKSFSKLLAIISGFMFFSGCLQEESINPALEERTTIVATSSVNVNFFGLGTANELYLYRSGPPVTLLKSTLITGLRPDEFLLAIDIRPSNKGLYGISNMDVLYRIYTPYDQSFLTAKAVMVSPEPFKIPLLGNLRAMDFHPQTGMIKVVTDAGQNLRIDPNTGKVVGEDMPVNSHGATVAINSLAYFGNYGTITSPVLYSMDVMEGKLYKLDSGTGNLTLVGPMGMTIMGEGGFDISAKGIPLVAFEMSASKTGSVVSNPASSKGYWLFRIDLKTGYATRLGALQPLNGIAIQ